jgi:hypothetical protein
MTKMMGTHARALIVGFAVASLMLSGKAFAGVAAVPELDPGMTVGGLTLLGIGVLLVIERYRARR